MEKQPNQPTNQHGAVWKEHYPHHRWAEYLYHHLTKRIMAKKLQVDVNAGEIIESFRPDLPPVFFSDTPPEERVNEPDVPE